LESIKRALARHYMLDLQAQADFLRHQYLRNVLHFYLHDGRVFVPFKFREARVNGDNCYGYVEIDQIAALVPGSPTCVQLKSGGQLPILNRIATARLAYLTGLEIEAHYTRPAQPVDLNVIEALTVLQRFLAGENKPVKESTPHPRVKFSARR